MSHENIPTFEPETFFVGETLEWTKDLEDFPAGEWTLTYYFRGVGTGFDAVATADGSAHSVTVPAATTAGLSAGAYFWQAWAEKGPEKHLVDQGRSAVKPSLAGVTTATAVDNRTQAERDLEAVRLALVGNLEVQEYTIGNRTLRRRSLKELQDLEQQLVRRVNAERRRERARQGGDFLQTINVRFDVPR